MAEQTIRTFIAVQLPDALKAEIEQIIGLLRRDRSRDPVRWVAPESLHLTLCFLGELPVSKVDVIGAILQGLGYAYDSFEVEVGGIGYFPNAEKAQVVYLGLSGNLKPLLALQHDLDTALQRNKLKPSEKHPFHPHLTLGRIDERKVLEREITMLTQRVAAQDVAEVGTWVISDLSLMQSTLTPTGPIYTELKTAYLDIAAFHRL